MFKVVIRLLELENGKICEGCIFFKGKLVEDFIFDVFVYEGLFYICEGWWIFIEFIVEENFIVVVNVLCGCNVKLNYECVYDFFFCFKECCKQIVGYFLGGEQQMLVFGCVMIVKFLMILMDELLLGFVFKIIVEIFDIVRCLNVEDGVLILLVEQNVNVVFLVVDYSYIMEGGQIVMEGDVVKLCDDLDVCSFYFGVVIEGEVCESFCDVKYYKCCKCWLSQGMLMINFIKDNFCILVQVIVEYGVQSFDKVVIC